MKFKQEINNTSNIKNMYEFEFEELEFGNITLKNTYFVIKKEKEKEKILYTYTFYTKTSKQKKLRFDFKLITNEKNMTCNELLEAWLAERLIFDIIELKEETK